jgi:hypothetical protein
MTDKQYKCLNGDIIEVGKEYKDVFAKDSITKVIAFYNNKIIGVYERGDKPSYDEFNENEFVSLWQEQPDKDGWILHTTGKQPVLDIKWVDAKWSDGFISYGVKASLLRTWKKDTTCPLGWVTHYRIVEDKQEPEESANNADVGSIKLKKLRKVEKIGEIELRYTELKVWSENTLEEYVNTRFTGDIADADNTTVINLISEYLQKKGI